MTLDDEKLDKLLHLLRVTAEEEIDCAEFLDRAAAEIERLVRAAPRAEHDLQVLQHLEVCPECREEFETVLDIVREDEPRG